MASLTSYWRGFGMCLL
uniref:Uncharacterized protein n=1 Tax=Nymphaea colorata TaxID=210225 RepID=A0A5K0ZB38_9MAGN